MAKRKTKKGVKVKLKEHTEVELMLSDIKVRDMNSAIRQVKRRLTPLDFNAKVNIVSVSQRLDDTWEVRFEHVFKVKLWDVSVDYAVEEYAQAGFIVLDVFDALNSTHKK